jgi:oxygen-independent coproporphyrinogen-3 oxidase
MPASLYVHIPFCIKKCSYCDFVSGIYTREQGSAYVTALKKEILSTPNTMPIRTLFLGGGTPTVLSKDSLMDLLTNIFRHFVFTNNYEATIEANPGTVEKEKLKSLLHGGVNRISIGIQSFHEVELACLGRVHSSGEAREAVLCARDAGFKNIGIDLIYGIPGQSVKSWKDSLERAVRLKPHHISAYELTVESGTPIAQGIQDGRLKLPCEEEVIQMSESAVEYLQAEGFLRYEISNFGLPGHFCEHNVNYWDRGEYYGAGLGAHSFAGGKRLFNTRNIHRYIQLLSEDKSPVAGVEDVPEDRAISEALFLGLRKTEGIRLEKFYRSYGVDVVKQYEKELKELQEAELIELKCRGTSLKEDTVLRLTGNGLLLSNEIFMKFL